MARTINGVAFPTDTLWTNQDAFHGVAQSVQPTLGGAVIIYANQAFAQDIEIEISDYGYASQDFRSEILSLASQVGANFAFIWDGFVRNVVFSHHLVPVEFVRIIPTRDHSDAIQKFKMILRFTVVS